MKAKIDARLEKEIERRILKARSLGEDVGKEKFPVIIEHLQRVQLPSGGMRKDRKRILEQETLQLQREIMKELSRLGITVTRQDPLGNSVSAELTIGQLEEVVKLDEVKKIRLLKEDIVTYGAHATGQL